MEERRKHKKRPCRVCRKWFTPNLRLGDRQQTCGVVECQRKWHARKCAEWNWKNRAYFREIYLRGRLESFGGDPPAKSSSPGSSCRIKDPPRRSSPLDLPKITGIDRDGQQWREDCKKNGACTWRGSGPISSDTGKSHIEGDMICTQYQKRLWGLEYCATVFRNYRGSYECKDEYFLCTDLGFAPFPLVK